MDVGAFAHELTELLTAAERTTGLVITVHDRTGAFIGLIPTYNAHRHWYCGVGKGQNPEYRHRCHAHCRFAVNEMAADPTARPFVHSCWKGASEATAAVHRDGKHLLTLFGGATRAGRAPPAGLAPEANRAWRQLPPADDDRLAAAATVLQAIGQRMLALLDAHAAEASGRRGLIDRLIEERMHQEVALEHVAKRLRLSVSRSSHVVAEIYGIAFGDLLRERRLARARRLLLSGDDPVGVIARRCGFISQHWFNRLFSRQVGESPARWRHQQRTVA